MVETHACERAWPGGNGGLAWVFGSKSEDGVVHATGRGHGHGLEQEVKQTRERQRRQRTWTSTEKATSGGSLTPSACDSKILS